MYIKNNNGVRNLLWKAIRNPALALNRGIAWLFGNPTIISPPSYSFFQARRVYGEAFLKAFEFLKNNLVEGDVAEFGTFNGFTARMIAKAMKKNKKQGHLHLFDSFQGFPAIVSSTDRQSYECRANVWRKGIFEVGAKTPVRIAKAVRKAAGKGGVSVHAGFFEETFTQGVIQNPLALVHIDCDLYQSAKFVLDALLRYGLLQDGAVVMFDDYYSGRANPGLGERKAFKEFLDAASEYTASHFFNYGWSGSAFIIHKNL